MLDMEKQHSILHMRVPPEWMQRLDRWREAQAFRPTRTEAIKTIVDAFLDSEKQPKAAPRERVPHE